MIWVCVHTNYLVKYYIRKERFDDALVGVDRNITRFEQLDKENKVVKWEYFVAHVLRGRILMAKGDIDDAKTELNYAFELYPLDAEVEKLRHDQVMYFKEAQNLLQELSTQ